MQGMSDHVGQTSRVHSAASVHSAVPISTVLSSTTNHSTAPSQHCPQHCPSQHYPLPLTALPIAAPNTHITVPHSPAPESARLNVHDSLCTTHGAAHTACCHALHAPYCAPTSKHSQAKQWIQVLGLHCLHIIGECLTRSSSPIMIFCYPAGPRCSRRHTLTEP